MYIDDIKNNYIYLNSMKNIVWERSNERGALKENAVITVEPEIEDIIYKLLKERPTWRFKSTEVVMPACEHIRLDAFEIYDGDEMLGTVSTERHWRDQTLRYYFTNSRIQKQRQRSGRSYTSKPEVAIKQILKAFHLKTPKERAAEAFAMVRASMQEVVNATEWPMRKAKAALERDMIAYFIKHWEVVREEVDGDTAKIDLPALAVEAHEGRTLLDLFQTNKGVIVRLEANGTYMVCRPENGSFEVLALTDTMLPEHIRGGLGLLKMLNEGEFVAGVGVRSKANTYFIVDKEGV